MSKALSEGEKRYDVSETKISTAGVFRCCLSSVAKEYAKCRQSVGIGTLSNCVHCGQIFRLEQKQGEAIWIPVEADK